MKKYYYVNAQGQQMPPVDFESLRSAGINANTMVWYEGLPNWVRAGDLPELAPIVGSVPPPGYGGYGQPGYNQPGYGPAMPPQAKPQSYLWLGILTTLLCCLPAGIVSIVYASKVDSYWNQGLYNEAQNASSKAQTWGYISLGVGLLVFILAFAVGMAGA